MPTKAESTRLYWALGGAVLCFLALALAYFYFQLYLGLPPCSLCILDRFIVGFLALCFLGLAWRQHWLLSILASLAIVSGLVVGARHIWLERFTAQDGFSSCLSQSGALGVIEFITSALAGAADCSVIYWQLFGLTLADLTFGLFIVLGLVLWQASFPKRAEQES